MQLNELARILEILEEISSGLMLLLILAYFTVIRKKGRGKWGKRTWLWIGRSQSGMKTACAVFVGIAAFSFVAGNTTDGPVERLTRIRAKALSDYTDIVWKIELSLGAHIRVEVCKQLYSSSTRSTKNAIKIENSIYSHPVPAEYYSNGHPGMTTKEILAWKDPRKEYHSAMRKSVDSILVKERTELRGVNPPSGVTLSEIDQIQTEADGLAEQQDRDLPSWLTRAGPDIIGKTVELTVSADHVPLLRAIGEQFPLVSEILDVGFESVDDALSEKIKAIAIRIARDRASGKTSSLRGVFRSAEKAIKLDAQPRPISKTKMMQLETLTLANKAIADSAQERFTQDLVAAINREANEVSQSVRLLRQLTPADGSSADLDLPDVNLLNSNQVSISRLRAERKARDHVDTAIALDIENIENKMGNITDLDRFDKRLERTLGKKKLAYYFDLSDRLDIERFEEEKRLINEEREYEAEHPSEDEDEPRIP